MTSTFFTFGSDPEYPFGEGNYVEIQAPDQLIACRVFQALYPNRPGSTLINCAFIYSEAEFAKMRDKYYKGVKPSVKVTFTVLSGEEVP